jgi:flagellar basal-body rod protein FlgB
MAISIDNVLGLHENAVKLRSKRTELIAGNIANADTPGYKARDFDFKQALDQARSQTVSPSHMKTTNPGHMTGNGGFGVDLQYSTPMQPSIDGNTVDLQIEKTKFTENAMRHQASLEFLDSKIKGMIRAIKGE